MPSDELTTLASPFGVEPDEETPGGAAPAENADLAFSATQTVTAGSLSATGCAIGSAKAESVEAVGSAIGMATVGGDLSTSFSATPLTYVRTGDASIRQSYASALVAGGTVEMSQALAPLVAGREIHIDMGGGVALVAGQARVERGWIGVLLSGKTELGDETRVLIGTRAALIIGAALLGGFALVALAAVFGLRKFVSDWEPLDLESLSERLPWHHGRG